MINSMNVIQTNVARRVFNHPLRAATLAVLAGVSPLALAGDLPAAMDRVPANSAIVVSVNNLEAVTGKFDSFLKSLGMEDNDDEDSPVQMGKKLLATPGLNKSGSLAVAILAGPDGQLNVGPEKEPEAVLIVPVSDYAAFVKAMGATETSGVTSLTIDEKSGFAKDIGGGFAALTTTTGLLDKFEGKAGNASAHKELLGKNGNSVTDSSDVVIIANVAALQTSLKEASEKMGEQLEQIAAMAGDQAAGMKNSGKLGQMVINNFARDGSIGILGVKLGDNGLSIDVGSQFKAGSELAGFFAASGKSAAMLTKVPNLPFYFAGAADINVPGVRTIMKNMTKMQIEALPEDQRKAAENSFQAMLGKDNVNGGAFVLGASPAAMMGGGLFVNTASYIATTDSASTLQAMSDASNAANGTKAGPATMKTTYKQGAAEIGGVKVDTWTSAMEFDPNDPMAGQAQMATGMLLGQSGLAGMSAAIDGGVVSVYSQNTPLMTSAIEAAKSGKSTLAEDALFKESQANLQAQRTFELYIGVKPLMDAGLGVMSMMGGGPEIKPPGQMSPIALGGTTADGGVTFRIFVPSNVIKGIADVVKQVEAAEEEEMEDEPAEPKKADEPARF